MLSQKLKKYLDDHQVKYSIVTHTPGYTAQEVAAVAHVKGKEFAKTAIVKIDGKLVMVVEPAHLKVNLGALKKALGAQNVELAREYEFKDKFPECELGAMPPFGELYGMEVYVGKPLAGDEEIAFNAGNHTELIRMSWGDFDRLVHPKVIDA